MNVNCLPALVHWKLSCVFVVAEMAIEFYLEQKWKLSYVGCCIGIDQININN